jgi:hypothetical protein
MSPESDATRATVLAGDSPPRRSSAVARTGCRPAVAHFGIGGRVQARRFALARPTAYSQRLSPLPANELEICVHVLLNPM